MIELGSLTDDTAHPTLLFYMYGQQSEYITSKVRALQTEPERQAFLRDFFKPYYSRLPGYSQDSPECQVTGCLTTDWLHDDLAGGGSYSNFQVDLAAGDDDVRAMREGVPDRRLWFAGEHTAPFVGLGTATGAYWSGEAVARRIAESVKGQRRRSTDPGSSK